MMDTSVIHPQLAEAIEGEALDDVEVIGVVTYMIHDAMQDERPL